MPGKYIGDDTGMGVMEIDGSPADIAVAPGEPVRTAHRERWDGHAFRRRRGGAGVVIPPAGFQLESVTVDARLVAVGERDDVLVG